MKPLSISFVILLIFGISILFMPKLVFAESLSSKLKGKILLQVESKGEAWYVSPVDGKRYSMGRPNDSFNLMKKLGIGISNSNLNKIQIADENLIGQDSDGDGLSDMAEDSIGTNKNNKDSDGDGYIDKDEILNGYNPNGAGKVTVDINFTKNNAGKIFLQTEKNGEAWYINPNNNKRYFLGRPNDTFNLMRKLGLGITNNDLNKITESANTTCDNYQCLITAASVCQPILVTISYTDIPFPLNPDMSASGQTKYEIKKASGLNDCILIFSSPIAVLSVSDEGRQAALNNGMTDNQINDQLQTMNNSLKSVSDVKTTCQSNASIISEYLTDAKNGNTKVEGKVNSAGQTTTYTTSSGQKLACTVTN